ncbi:inosine/xanthosine triphosphatase [Caldalkalibacillus uzonensis]|uniref:inosine/xanthosine triphosphatase n=1 Tax=Caldalkalibacillus uzonensis TaxID=353224 RepID=A0ABU0CRA8_9BACI|nr:DUF84 family protein [Caldalkalibacillus uzonensis]MDQ0338909.1 inosine/xanthosine triphosphatase [Caldalkalibacillus uzonensis]
MLNQKVIYVGSENPAKIKAVELAIAHIISVEKQHDHAGNPAALEGVKVLGRSVPSGVSAQPRSDEETIQGALNRCRVLKKESPGAICIGLEGGVQESSHGLLLTNWGALIDEKGQTYIAGGLRLPLPAAIADEIRAGQELGTVIDGYARQTNVRQKEGAVGILTQGYIDRSQLFCDIVLLLFGQMKHYSAAKI